MYVQDYLKAGNSNDPVSTYVKQETATDSPPSAWMNQIEDEQPVSSYEIETNERRTSQDLDTSEKVSSKRRFSSKVERREDRTSYHSLPQN